MKTKHFAPLLSTLSALSLQGCLTVGDEFPTNVKWIQIGTTKKADIRTRVGEPFRKGYDSGLLTYTYAFYRYSVFRPTRTKDLTIRFKEDGTVHSYTFASSFEEDKNQVDK
jgi:hypothetical protein